MSDDKLREAQKTIMLLEEELKRLSEPPYIAGTVLNIGDKTVRVSLDGAGVFEVNSAPDLDKKLSLGSRVLLSPASKTLLSLSEFSKYGGDIAVVDEIIGNRLKIQAKGECSLIMNALQDVKPGDEILLDPSRAVALERLDRKNTKYHLEEVPKVPWTNIGGLGDVIKKIRQEVEEPFIHKEIYARYGRDPVKGILLYGPPGCGKTLIAKAIAYNISKVNGNDAKGYFIRINGPELLDKWLGNTEANIRRIYGVAREIASEKKGLVVVFIDEAESILKSRGTGISTDAYDSIVPQFLAEMNGTHNDSNILTLLATNREDILDPAVLRDGRIDRRIKIPRPDKDGIAEILQIYLKGVPISKDVGKDINKLSYALAENICDEKNLAYSVIFPAHGLLGNFSYRHLVSGALLKGSIDRASSFAIAREINNGAKGISRSDLEQAIKDELTENTGFSQTLVKEDWEDVFGSQGRQYQEACRRGQLILERYDHAQPKKVNEQIA